MTTLAQRLTTSARRAWIIGILAAIAAAFGCLTQPKAFYQAYLMAYLFWVSVPLGSLVLLMIHHLTGGAWAFAIRRPMEAAIRTLPITALMFLPIIAGIPHLFQWADPAVIAVDKVVQLKSLYLNVPFFILRAGIYFTVWIAIGRTLTRWSSLQDETADPYLNQKMRILSGAGLLLYSICTTFASFDWLMSLDAHWFSSIYGPLFVVSQALTALCFMIVVLVMIDHFPPLSKIVNQDVYHAQGNMIFASVMLWAYMTFSQFLIIWSGNLPEFIEWFVKRSGPVWKILALLLSLFHFAIPFLVMLSRLTKQKSRILVKIAAGLLVMRFLDLYWLIAPDLHHGAFMPSWLDVVVPVALGGIWIGFFVRKMMLQSLVVLHDPRFPAQNEKGSHE